MGVMRLYAKSNNIEAYITACAKAQHDLTTRLLIRIGEECVKRVRDRSPNDSWNDQTGNLRSSVGYMLLYNKGCIKKGGFHPTSSPEGNGQEGQSEGQQYAENIASLYIGNYTLVIVAGMEYAEYVEAMENKDVLASTELWLRAEWDKQRSALKQQLDAKFNDLANKYGV